MIIGHIWVYWRGNPLQAHTSLDVRVYVWAHKSETTLIVLAAETDKEELAYTLTGNV